MSTVALAASDDGQEQVDFDPALRLIADALSPYPSRVWHAECLTYAVMQSLNLSATRFDANGRILPPCQTCANRPLTPVR